MIHSQTGKDTILFAPQGITDGATVTANLDTRGADYATGRLNFAAEDTTTVGTDPALSLLESDDTVVTNFATITADQTVDTTAATVAKYEVDLRGRKRYLRLSVTAGTVTGADCTFSATSTLFQEEGVTAATHAGANTVFV